MPTIGLDLGGTKLAAAFFTDAGEAMWREVVALEGRRGRAVGQLIGDQVQRQIDLAREHSLAADAVGVSVPGIYRARTGRVWAPNIPGWEDYPLREELEHLTGDGVAVRVDSDRTCYILGETWQGAAKGVRNAVFLAVGTGIGAGILVDGRVIRGHGDAAGAIGWLALDRPYRTAYDACGCFEYHASGPGLARVALDEISSDDAYAGPLREINKETLTAQDIFAALEEGDPLALRVLENAIAFWGMAVANLVSLFNPEIIIFGGGVFGPASAFLDRIYLEARRWAQPISIRQVRLEISRLGDDAGLYGAAHLPRTPPPDLG